MRPPGDRRASRPIGLTLIALGTWAAGLWSLVAALLPGSVSLGPLPVYPPILVMTRRILGGETRLVTTVLDSGQARFATLAICVALLALGTGLWRRIRHGQWVFLACLWIAPVYYAVALYHVPVVHASLPTIAGKLTDSGRTVALSLAVAVAGSLIWVTAYLIWKRHEFAPVDRTARKSP